MLADHPSIETMKMYVWCVCVCVREAADGVRREKLPVIGDCYIRVIDCSIRVS